jgi:hypothetical protein
MCPAAAAPPEPASARGSGSLPVVLLLLVGATLAWLHVNRALLAEVRASAATVRASSAREAAEAGLGWTLAHLHTPAPTGAACTPESAASAAFIDQVLPVNTAEAGRYRRVGGGQPACVLHPAGWSCACPASGVGAPAAPAASDAAAPAFRIRFEAGPAAPLLWLHSEGCSEAALPCQGGAVRNADAHRPVRVLLGLLAALPRPPEATVNAFGDVQLIGDVQVVNDHAERAWTVITAGGLSLDTTARLVGRAGQPALTTARQRDVSGPPDAARWFTQPLALSGNAYRELPHVHRLRCSPGCGGADLATAVAAGHRVLWHDGDLTLDTATSLGGPEDPVLLVTTGRLQIGSGMTLHGVLHAGGAVDWSSGSPGLLRGALSSAGTVRLAGPLRLVRDEAIVARLAHALGTWAPAPGSWHDLGD